MSTIDVPFEEALKSLLEYKPAGSMLRRHRAAVATLSPWKRHGELRFIVQANASQPVRRGCVGKCHVTKGLEQP